MFHLSIDGPNKWICKFHYCPSLKSSLLCPCIWIWSKPFLIWWNWLLVSGIGECGRSSYKTRKVASRVACIKFQFWKRASKSCLFWPWENKEAKKRGWIFWGILQSESSFPSAGFLLVLSDICSRMTETSDCTPLDFLNVLKIRLRAKWCNFWMASDINFVFYQT